jgi:Predicted Rossmann fold nucleotide-binding protein involved in DNA uptake
MGNEQADILLSLFVSGITFLTFYEKNNIWKNLDNSDSLALLSINDISKIVGRSCRSDSWDSRDNLNRARIARRIMESYSIIPLFNTAPAYPALLRETVNPPFILFYRGNARCLTEKTVSVVGTRRMTPEGKDAAFSFAYDAAADGVTVVSGLADGIDGAAHSGAVESWFTAQDAGTNECGTTAAVLPCGPDCIAPANHRKLAARILAAGGCLVSEYMPGTPVEPWRFVHRNRIIAALSPATVVVQAPPGSGALITAEYAADYSRDVVFHEAAFSKNADAVSAAVKTRLERRFASGRTAKRKIENTPEKYLSDGAPVIQNYADYCRCLAEMPGLRSTKQKNNDGQLPLF